LWATIQSPYPLYIQNIFFPFLILNNAYTISWSNYSSLQCLNTELSNSFAFSPTHLVSCWHIKLIFLLLITSIISIYVQVRVPLFHVQKQIILSWTNFFTHTCSQRCGTLAYFLLHSGIDVSTSAHLTLYFSYTTRFFLSLS
jgi:hypothetical protein